MTTSAIQQDVPASNIEPKPAQREPSARELAMEQLSQNRNAAFTEETGIEIESSSLTDPDIDPADAEADAARNAADVPATDRIDQIEQQLTAPANDLSSRKVKVKIDGIESEVTVEDMQREYQKGRTADKRLAEAAELRRQLDTEQLAAQSRAAPADEVRIDPEATKKFTSAMFEGDEEAASTAFQAAVSSAVKEAVTTMGRSNATPAVDTAAIAQQVKQQMLIDSVLKQSKTDYPQMYADPDIEALGAAKIQRSMSEGKSFEQALETVSTELATKFNWSTSGRQSAAPSTTTRNAKLERKAGIDNVTSINVKSSSTEAAPLTNSQIIADMAKARGQAM